MRSVPADRHFLAGRPRWWAAGLVLCALVVLAAYLLANRPQEARLPTGRPAAATGGALREQAAASLLSRLTSALERGSRARVLGLAAPGDPAARRELAAVFANVRALRVRDLSLRYIDDDAGRLDPAQERRAGGRAWVGDVQLGWRLAGYDRADSHVETTMTFARTGRGAAFVSARGDYGDLSPLWLLDRLHVERTGRSLVMTTRAADVGRFSTLADRAVDDVRKVLHDWHGKLVVEVPADQQQLDRILDADPHTYDEIAAVTTTVDGTLVPSAPTHIFVNPRVFEPLGPNGSQIVMSHEATHVATHAATTSIPTWLLEGFADYVALDHVDLPVSVTASQIIAQVRKHGVPAHLPGKVEFDTANTALGASYESAWLACRLIGQQYGEAKMLAFYRMAQHDSSTTRAFREVLGTNARAFTKDWQAYLHQLAG